MTASPTLEVAIAAADRALFPGFRPFRQAANGVEIAGSSAEAARRCCCCTGIRRAT